MAWLLDGINSQLSKEMGETFQHFFFFLMILGEGKSVLWNHRNYIYIQSVACKEVNPLGRFQCTTSWQNEFYVILETPYSKTVLFKITPKKMVITVQSYR